jgi:hypothetical protein
MIFEVGQWYLCIGEKWRVPPYFMRRDVIHVLKPMDGLFVEARWFQGSRSGECSVYTEQPDENFRLLSEEEVLIYKMSL